MKLQYITIYNLQVFFIPLLYFRDVEIYLIHIDLMRKRCQLINVDVDVDVDANESSRQLVEDGITTRTCMARGFSVLRHVFAREQCILCSGLRHKSYLTLLYVTPSCYTLELSRTALLGCRLAASRLRVAARWKLSPS